MKRSLRSHYEEFGKYVFKLKGEIVMDRSSNKLVDLSVSFAVEILNLVKYLKSQH